jgi:hypothetical protein
MFTDLSPGNALVNYVTVSYGYKASVTNRNFFLNWFAGSDRRFNSSQVRKTAKTLANGNCTLKASHMSRNTILCSIVNVLIIIGVSLTNLTRQAMRNILFQHFCQVCKLPRLMLVLIQEEIKRGLNSRNACYYSSQNPFSSRVLSKNIKIKK